MSAWIVSKAHIDLLLTAGLVRCVYGPLTWEESDGLDRRIELTPDTANGVGMMLWAENVRSVSYRYSDEPVDDLPGPTDFGDDAMLSYRFQRFQPVLGAVDPVVVLKQIAGYEYQSCEHVGWATSQARRFCDALRHRMIGRLPGYDAAPWGIDDHYQFTRS